MCLQGGCEGEEVLSGVVTLCQCALSLESPVVPSELTDTLQTLHGTGGIVDTLCVVDRRL